MNMSVKNATFATMGAHATSGHLIRAEETGFSVQVSHRSAHREGTCGVCDRCAGAERRVSLVVGSQCVLAHCDRGSAE